MADGGEKEVGKLINTIKGVAPVVAIVVAMAMSWARLTSATSSNSKAIEQVAKDLSSLKIQLEKVSGVTADHETDIRVIETQLKALGGAR